MSGPVAFDFFISMDRHVPEDGACLIFAFCYRFWCMFTPLVRQFDVVLFADIRPVDVRGSFIVSLHVLGLSSSGRPLVMYQEQEVQRLLQS